MSSDKAIQIPDYGCGNLLSIRRMIEKVGGRAEIVNDPSQLDFSAKLILAGVGAFDHGMSNLRSGGWFDALNEAVLRHKAPVLGICLGMQLLCRSSEEGQLAGLGWIDGDVRRIAIPEGSNLKIPHMGWNTLDVVKRNPLIDQDDQERRFYFVHSYHVVCRDPNDISAVSHHGRTLTAAFSRDNIYGVQFHPEKSHRFGMELIRKFVDLPC